MGEMRSNERAAKRQERKEKDADSYDWNDLVHNGKVGKLTVPELNKYLVHNDLSQRGNKRDKVRRIIAHVSKTFEEVVIEFEPDSDDSESDSDDIVLEEFGGDDNDVDDNGDIAFEEISVRDVELTLNESNSNVATQPRRCRSSVKSNDYIYY